MRFDQAAAGKTKQTLVVCEDVSKVDPGFYKDSGVEVRNVSLRGLSVDESLPLLVQIRESALSVRHEIPSRDTNAMLNAVGAHMVVLARQSIQGADQRLVDSLTQTIRDVHQRLTVDNPRMATSFLRQTMASYGSVDRRGFYDQDASRAVRETVNDISSLQHSPEPEKEHVPA